jgi:hypothetical protein
MSVLCDEETFWGGRGGHIRKLSFLTRNCSRNHYKNKAHAIDIGLLSAWLSKFTIIGRNVFTVRPLLLSNMVEHSSASDADFYTDFCGVFSMKAEKWHNSKFGMQVDHSADNISYSRIPKGVSPVVNSFSARRWLPKSLLKGFHHWIHCPTCIVFLYLHPNTRHQTLPPWSNYHYVPLSRSEIA